MVATSDAPVAHDSTSYPVSPVRRVPLDVQHGPAGSHFRPPPWRPGLLHGQALLESQKHSKGHAGRLARAQHAPGCATQATAANGRKDKDEDTKNSRKNRDGTDRAPTMTWLAHSEPVECNRPEIPINLRENAMVARYFSFAVIGADGESSPRPPPLPSLCTPPWQRIGWALFLPPSRPLQPTVSKKRPAVASHVAHGQSKSTWL